jgi:hypothetical protein
MASAHIYPEHHELLDNLITSAKVGSQSGAAQTGPFKEYRDAYVFAASIGLALGAPTQKSQLPASRKKATPIRDSVLFRTPGAEELSLAAVMLQDLGDEDSPEPSLRMQLEEIANGDITVRLELLDLYAYSGFGWLAQHVTETKTIRELVLQAIDTVSSIDRDAEEYLVANDPLGGFLLG